MQLTFSLGLPEAKGPLQSLKLHPILPEVHDAHALTPALSRTLSREKKREEGTLVVLRTLLVKHSEEDASTEADPQDLPAVILKIRGLTIPKDVKVSFWEGRGKKCGKV